MTARYGLVGILLLLGAGWGLTQPLSKIAVEGGLAPIGMVVWQCVTGAVLLTAIQIARRRPFRTDRPALFVYTVVALLGAVIPSTTSYFAYAHVPAGVMSILISTVPMIAFPIALAVGSDRFDFGRIAGLALGLCGVILLIGPQESLPATAAGWVLVGLIAPACYACEANFVGGWGTAGLGAIQVLHGACLVGAILALPVALLSGQMFWPAAPTGPGLALVASSVINALAYSLYVWLVGRAGATFAAQCAYLITGFGVLWAMLLLGERYSGWAWLALTLVMGGVFLVQPRAKPGLAASVPPGENTAS